MTAQEARTLIDYTGWASRKVLAAARQLSQEDLQRSNGISHGSIAGTLVHIYLADRVWCERITGANLPLVWDATLAEAEVAWPEYQRQWEQWAARQTDADLAADVTYLSISGSQASTPAEQIVMHVVNHATLHRGQVVGMIRQLGVQPPATDMIYYFREMAAAKA